MHRSRSSRLVRVVLFVAASAVTLMTLSTASSAHAGFKAYSAFGFAPNLAGGSNAASGDQATPPYAAGATVTMYVRSAVEIPDGESWDPALHSNVDMKIIVPSGWTNPTCGSANLQVNNGSTNSTNQPGAAVAGWQCETYLSAGHAVIHFWGPPVASGGLASDAAQYFVFSVTTPSPAIQTTYGVGGTEGFTADQQYANGEISHWYPSADYVGTYPAGAAPTTPAGGLLRTVAAAEPTTTTTPSGPVTPAFTG